MVFGKKQPEPQITEDAMTPTFVSSEESLSTDSSQNMQVPS